jgi:TRAP transporter 4TM/12TM fusion protein
MTTPANSKPAAGNVTDEKVSSKNRLLKEPLALSASAIAIAFSLFQLYVLGIHPISPWYFRAIHLSFVLALVFLLRPARKSSPWRRCSIPDALSVLLGISLSAYIISQGVDLADRIGVEPTGGDLFFGAVAVILVLEAARRYLGKALPGITLIFLLYAYFGYLIPGDFGLPQYSFQKIVSYLFSTLGIYGVAISASAKYVFLFILFGTFMLEAGVGKVFIDLAASLAGRFRGGPAKVAVLSSALFGSVSGSASSNVVTTGTFTIPLMKSMGYRPHFAGAVETTASIGGLFMPPIMGAGAFIMAEILGVEYMSIVKAAIIPACLYFISLLFLVDLESVRLKLSGIDRTRRPRLSGVLKNRGYLLLPMLLLIYMLVIAKVSPVRAGIWGIIGCYFIALFRRETRFSMKRLLQTLDRGARGVLTVTCATACAGIIVGVVSMTGFGISFSVLLTNISGQSVFLALVLVMIACIVLGIELPITATYITAASICGPALVNLGIDRIPAHLFIFFFSAVSGMTPPVCVTAYAAAGLAEADPIRVGFTSMRLGALIYVVPYMFIYGPQLLLRGRTGEIVTAVMTAVIGILCFSTGIYGWFLKKIGIPERLMLVASGVLFIKVGMATNILGMVLLALVGIMTFFRHRRSAEQPQEMI